MHIEPADFILQNRSSIESNQRTSEMVNSREMDAVKTIPIMITSSSSLSTIASANMRNSFPSPVFFLGNHIFCFDKEHTQYAGEYIDDIFSNLLTEEREATIKPAPDFMERQNEINGTMREILIDWIVDMHWKTHLKPRTLYLMIHIIDTYLSFKQIQRSKFQLLGIAAFLIACKTEEIMVPKMENLLYMTDNAFTKDELVEMESDICKVLNFNFVFPLAFDFYEIDTKLLGFNEEEYFLGLFFIESYLLNKESVKIPGSILAITAAYIVMKFFKKRGYEICYDPALNSIHVDKNTIKDVSRTVCIYIDNLQTRQFSTKTKFLTPEFKCVAKYSSDEY